MSFFKPKDFELSKTNFCDLCTVEIAKTANKLLEERGVRVYGQQYGPTNHWNFDEVNHPDNTYQALLINIEEIPKKECEHEPANKYISQEHFCVLCGIKLKLKWEPV